MNQDGGGLTFAPGPHTEDFLDCRDALKNPGFRARSGSEVEAAVHAKTKLDRISMSPTFEPGDVLLATRWLFHCGNPYKEGSEGARGDGAGRYTVRYMPGEATVVPVTIGERKLVYHADNVLRDADPERYPAIQLD